MEKKNLWLGGMLFFVVAVRLFLALHTPAFAYEGYALISQINSPFGFFPHAQSSSSYEERYIFFSPVFSFLLALFSSIFPLWWVAKVIPNLFATMTSFFIYLLLLRLTKHEAISLFTAALAGVSPLFLDMTVSTLSPHALALPYLFACLYFYLRSLDDKKVLPILLTLIFVFPFIHPSAIFFLLGLLFYHLVCLAQGIHGKKIEGEIFIFSGLYMLWTLFLLFKKAFLVHGFAVIWQNIPSQILDHYFEPLSLLLSFGAIGVLPIIFGTYIIYKYTFGKGEQEWYLFIGFALSFFVLISLKLVAPRTGLLYLGVFLFVLCGRFFSLALDYLEKTKFAEHKKRIVFCFVIFFVLLLFAFSPQYEQNEPTPPLLDALSWVAKNTSPDATLLGALEQGHLIVALTGRKTVWDTSFLLVPSIDQRFNDVAQIFQTSLEVAAVKNLAKYHVNYIIFDDLVKKQYHVTELAFVNGQCFSPVYEHNGVIIYKLLCGVKEL